jgi:hypothetical protein
VSVFALALVTLLGAPAPGAGEAADTSLRLVLGADAPAPGQPSATFDFDLLPEQAKTPADLLKAEQIDHELQLRRTMLKLHQAFGIATVALLAATVVVGQMNYYDKFSGQNTGQFEVWHDYFEAATTASFATTGLLALFAPVPIPKKTDGTMLVHKVAMITATAGFAAEIILGIVTVSLEGHENQQTLAEAHLVTGYATAAATATGVGALFFQ